MLLLLDVSGSMNEKISSGGTKFAAAKRALSEVADALPAGTQVGLRVYGSEIAEPKDENPKACTDTELVLPIGPLNKAKMTDAVDSFTAKGETPIAYSLQQSVEDLGGDGKRVLVLISDGEETCAKDPCPTAEEAGQVRRGPAVQRHRAGRRRQGAPAAPVHHQGRGRQLLRRRQHRRPQRRGPSHHPAGAAPLPGDRHSGAGHRGRRGAPPIGPGQYKDRYDASTIARYYRITRTPGSTVTASIGSIVRPYPTAEHRAVDDDVGHARRDGLRHHPGHHGQIAGHHRVRRRHQLQPGRRGHPHAGPAGARPHPS